MRVIKLAILSFVFLFLLVTIISLFIPSHIRISRATDINNTKQAVMNFIADPLKWKEWYPGADSLGILYIEGKPKGILLDSSGLAGLCIINVSDSVIIAGEVGSSANQQMETGWKVLPAASENSVTLQWYMDLKLKWYPWEKFRSLFLENIYGPHLEKGLANLKAVSEDRRSSINYP
jgi:hypothetical protein